MPKVKVGNDNADGVAGQSTYSAHVGGGSMSFDSAGDLYIGTGRRRRPVRPGRQRLRPARPALPAALRLPQHVREHQRPARQGAAHPPARERLRRARRRHHLLGPDREHVRAREPRAPGPRSSRWASATRSRSRPTRRTRARSSSATTAPTRAPTTRRAARPGSSNGTASPSRASTAGRCARATTRRRTATSATRSRAGRPARASTARRRRSPTSRPTTAACRASPVRPWGPTCGTSARASIPPRFAIPAQAAPQESITRADLLLRRVEPVDHEVAGVLRRRVVPARPQPELVARDPREGRRQRDPARERPLRVDPVRLAQPHLPDPGQVRARRLAVRGDVGLRLLPRPASHQPAGPADAGGLHRRRGGHHRAGGQREPRGHPQRGPASTSGARRSR